MICYKGLLSKSILLFTELVYISNSASNLQAL
jgi:hypothetical protein